MFLLSYLYALILVLQVLLVVCLVVRLVLQVLLVVRLVVLKKRPVLLFCKTGRYLA